MQYLDLLGTNLKGEFLCDLFETYDVQVIYEYDRTHENLADAYRAAVPEIGLQFVFDDKQLLQTLFLKTDNQTTFNPFEGDDERIRRFDSKLEALSYATANGLQFTEGTADFLGEQKDWIRFESDTHSVHYEYVNSELRMITLQAVDDQA